MVQGMGARGACYANANEPRVKFTGKERDVETGLDYFGARYFSGAQGRFTTPDWSETPQPVPYADFSDPQTLNLYIYARNNPLTLTDPDGHCPWCIGGLVGGGMDIGIQLLTGRSLSNLDWTSVAISAAAGAVGGGIAAKTGQLAWYGKLAIEGGLDAAASVVQQEHKKGTISPTETAIDVVAGRAVGGMVSSVVANAAASSPIVKQLLKEADRKTRIAAAAEARGNASSAARRNAQAGALKSEVNSIVYGRAAGASTAASQVASEAAKAAERRRKKQEDEHQ
jgi:RHS repeat-associated protein